MMSRIIRGNKLTFSDNKKARFQLCPYHNGQDLKHDSKQQTSLLRSTACFRQYVKPLPWNDNLPCIKLERDIPQTSVQILSASNSV